MENIYFRRFQNIFFNIPAEAVPLPDRPSHRRNSQGDDNSAGCQGTKGYTPPTLSCL